MIGSVLSADIMHEKKNIPIIMYEIIPNLQSVLLNA